MAGIVGYDRFGRRPLLVVRLRSYFSSFWALRHILEHLFDALLGFLTLAVRRFFSIIVFGSFKPARRHPSHLPQLLYSQCTCVAEPGRFLLWTLPISDGSARLGGSAERMQRIPTRGLATEDGGTERLRFVQPPTLVTMASRMSSSEICC